MVCKDLPHSTEHSSSHCNVPRFVENDFTILKEDTPLASFHTLTSGTSQHLMKEETERHSDSFLRHDVLHPCFFMPFSQTPINFNVKLNNKDNSKLFQEACRIPFLAKYLTENTTPSSTAALENISMKSLEWNHYHSREIFDRKTSRVYPESCAKQDFACVRTVRKPTETLILVSLRTSRKAWNDSNVHHKKCRAKSHC